MENTLGSLYNSAKEEIAMPEYGRMIQEYIQFAINIADDRRRQATAESIAHMMILLTPGSKSNMDEVRERVWNHLFRISDYKLNVVAPAGVVVLSPEERTRPEPIGYPPHLTKFRHYGHGIQQLIAKAIEMPDGPKKEGFKEVIASYMKLAYKTWNREHYVSDDIVKDDLEILSGGKLSLADGHSSLDYLAAGVDVKDLRRGVPQQDNGRKRNQSRPEGKSKGRKRSYSNKRR